MPFYCCTFQINDACNGSLSGTVGTCLLPDELTGPCLPCRLDCRTLDPHPMGPLSVSQGALPQGSMTAVAGSEAVGLSLFLLVRLARFARCTRECCSAGVFPLESMTNASGRRRRFRCATVVSCSQCDVGLESSCAPLLSARLLGRSTAVHVGSTSGSKSESMSTVELAPMLSLCVRVCVCVSLVAATQVPRLRADLLRQSVSASCSSKGGWHNCPPPYRLYALLAAALAPNPTS